MKKNFVILLVGFMAAATSCNKDNASDIIPSDQIVCITVPEMTLGLSEEDTKVSEFVQSKRHYFQWEEGDKIAVFSMDGSNTAHTGTTGDKMISSLGTFKATSVVNPDKTHTSAVFTGSIPEDVTVYPYVYAVYPDNGTVTVTNTTSTSQGYYINCYIPEVQDGDASKYIYLTTRYQKGTECKITKNEETGAYEFSPLGKFVLATPITMINILSPVEIVKIEIEGQDIKGWTGNCKFRTNAGSVYDSSDNKLLTLKKEVDGVLQTLVPPDEATTLSWAVRHFEPLNKTQSSITIVFRFYAADGTICTKTAVCTQGQSANTIVHLGTVDLTKDDNFK